MSYRLVHSHKGAHAGGSHHAHAFKQARHASTYHVNMGMVTVFAGCTAFWAAIAALLVR